MRSLKDTANDMRALASILLSSADELDKVVDLFGGKNTFSTEVKQASPFPEKKRRDVQKQPVLNQDQKAQIRQIWNSIKSENKTKAKRQELAKQFGVGIQSVVATLRELDHPNMNLPHLKNASTNS